MLVMCNFSKVNSKFIAALDRPRPILPFDYMPKADLYISKTASSSAMS